MNYKEIGDQIIRYVGGAGNVKSITHCATRLRIVLNDVSKVDKEAIENTDKVLGAVYAGGQFQIILGQTLIPIYESITKNNQFKESEIIKENLDDPNNQPLTWKNAGSKIIDFVSSAVSPLVAGLVAGGMLKVMLLLVITFINPALKNTSGYLLLSAVADAPFYFMPIFVAWGAAQKLGATPIYAMIASAALLHGNYLALVKAAKNITLFGLNVRALDYGTSLLPALLIAIVAYWSEKFFNRIVPGIFKSILVGMGTIFVSGSLGYLVLGPIGQVLGQGIANIFMFLHSTIGPLAVGLLAAALPWMVMAGMHHALTPFMPQLLSNPGYDTLLRPAFLLHNMSEGGANIGVALRTKKKKFRSECWSLALGCIVAGVTEPALYGVNLKLKRPMYGVMAGGFVGGIVAGALGAKAYVVGYSNLIALPIFKESVLAMLVGVVVAIIVSATVTFILGIEENPEVTPAVKQKFKDDEIVAAASGKLLPLSDVKDEVFSSGAVGKGIAIKLDSDFICAPANGKIESIFPTGHAFGLKMKDGQEILVHIGINTVDLKGKNFDVLAKAGDQVRAGQPIVRINRKIIEKEGYDTTTMMIFTNQVDDYELKDEGIVHVGSLLTD